MNTTGDPAVLAVNTIGGPLSHLLAVLAFTVFVVAVGMVVLLLAEGCQTASAPGPVEIDAHEPWINDIAAGRKSVECLIGPSEECADWTGQRVAFCVRAHRVDARVVRVRHYDTLEDYIRGEGFASVAPRTASFAEALEAYRAIRLLDGDRMFSDERVSAGGGLNALEVRLS